jgi:hypothetical protein
MGSVLVVAIALTLFRIPLASSQGLTLVAAQVSGDLPTTDPASALWQEATAIEVPLSAQNVTRPILPDTKIKSVTARALHNGSQLALLLEWSDDTQDDQMVRVQDFRDAVAVQFPLAEGPPFFCMGQQGGNVNIWHWKADWQADITARQDMDTLYPNMYVDQYPFVEPATNISAGPGDYIDPNYLPALASGNLFASPTHDSPVEDLVAGGFGSLTAQPVTEQNVQGYGVWADGKWRVIFSRDLAPAEADDITFTSGRVYSIAFAAWDGANGERNGQKSTSQWVSLQAESTTPRPAAQPAPAVAKDQLEWSVLFLICVEALALLIGLVVIVFLVRLQARESS